MQLGQLHKKIHGKECKIKHSRKKKRRGYFLIIRVLWWLCCPGSFGSHPRHTPQCKRLVLRPQRSLGPSRLPLQALKGLESRRHWSSTSWGDQNVFCWLCQHSSPQVRGLIWHPVRWTSCCLRCHSLLEETSGILIVFLFLGSMASGHVIQKWHRQECHDISLSALSCVILQSPVTSFCLDWVISPVSVCPSGPVLFMSGHVSLSCPVVDVHLSRPPILQGGSLVVTT